MATFFTLYAISALLIALGVVACIVAPSDPWTSWEGIPGDD